MAAINNMLVNELNLLEYKRKEATDYLAFDAEELNRIALHNIGVTFDIDEVTGVITNYQEIMDKVWA